MDKVIEEAQRSEKFPKSEKIEQGSDGWLSPEGNYYKVGTTQHDESASFLVSNSFEVQDGERRRFRHSYDREDYDVKNDREKLKELGWILINGSIFRTDNALNYTTNQLTKLSEAGIPVIGVYDGSKEFSSEETLEWVNKTAVSVSDFIGKQELIVPSWIEGSRKINLDEYWSEINGRGYNTLEDFKRDPFHTKFGDFGSVRFNNVRDVITKGYKDEIVFDRGMETYTLRLLQLPSGERICVEHTYHHHDRDSGNEDNMNVYVVDNFTFKDKIKKYLSTEISPQIKGDYFKELIESK